MELQGYGATGGGPQRPSAESTAAAPADPERGKLLPGGAALPSGPLSVAAATVVVCKALLGVTLFETPWAAANAGVLLTPLWLVLISMACLYTAQMLVTVRRTAALVALDEGPLPSMDSLPALVDCCLGAMAAVVTELAVLVASFGLLTVYLVREAPPAAGPSPASRPRLQASRAHARAQSFAASALQPLLPAFLASSRTTWALTPPLAALCVARRVEHSALMAGAGLFAATLAAVGLSAVFVSEHAHGAFPAPRAASAGAWAEWDSGGSAGLAPAPARALALCASGFLLHFMLPSLESGMTAPRRIMEAVARGSAIATAALIAFGSLGAWALSSPPQQLLSLAGDGATAFALRLAVLADVLFTAPLLARPGLVQLDALWERAQGQPPGPVAAAVMRCAAVAAAAAAACARSEALAFLAVVACTACTLVLPPLLLILSTKPDGELLITTSGAERSAAAAIAAFSLSACLLGAMALSGALGLGITPEPTTPGIPDAPPAPGAPSAPTEGEYDYFGQYAPPLLYAFTRRPVDLVSYPSPPSPVHVQNWSNAAEWNNSASWAAKWNGHSRS